VSGLAETVVELRDQVAQLQARIKELAAPAEQLAALRAAVAKFGKAGGKVLAAEPAPGESNASYFWRRRALEAELLVVDQRELLAAMIGDVPPLGVALARAVELEQALAAERTAMLAERERRRTLAEVAARAKEDFGPYEIERPGVGPVWCCFSCGVYGEQAEGEGIAHARSCLYAQACKALGEKP
jgi:hypothetical protein